MTAMLAAYTAVISARYRMLLQYRTAAFAGILTQLFWGAIKVMVMAAFFQYSTQSQPMNLAQVVTYIWLGQAFLGMLPWNTDREIEQQVREGSVVYELLRPVDVYFYWYCRTIALRTATTTLRSVPIFIVAGLMLPAMGLDAWKLSWPPDLTALLSFMVSMAGALAVAVGFTNLMHVTLVYALSGDGINRIMPSVTMIFSGMVLPLPLFPDWAQTFLNWQPFRGLVDVPFRIYMGHINGAEILPAILHQFVWGLIFIAIGRWMMQRSLRRLEVQGG
ncbi:MAG: ABC-2 family transporter protein [Pseudomonadales bacterium]|nr:ABC-2 family transporter protein [Pseudomonadales bacterium]